jgi:hypothetical protein
MPLLRIPQPSFRGKDRAHSTPDDAGIGRAAVGKRSGIRETPNKEKA